MFSHFAFSLYAADVVNRVYNVGNSVGPFGRCTFDHHVNASDFLQKKRNFIQISLVGRLLHWKCYNLYIPLSYFIGGKVRE